jgi:diacylglycerol O-acyltransferase / wax synthase
MRNHEDGDRLSWGDTVFLNLEREGMPLNVACLCVLEGDIAYKEYLRFVESRLPLIPRFLKRVVAPPLNIGLPVWNNDPAFDIHRHVRTVTLKHGTEAELKAFAGKTLGKVMDRNHPLWDFTLVRGLKGNRTALIARMHHCLADGIAGIGIMSALMDVTPKAPRLAKRKLQLELSPAPDTMTSIMDGMATSYSNFMERALSAWVDVLNITERTLANGGLPASEELSSFLPEITAPTERLCFNVLYRGPQKFACAEISLAEIKAIRHVCGASVNDVLLALITATVRRYSEFHGDQLKGRLLRIMVPVNLRGSDGAGELGNRISLIAVNIPLDIRNPRKLLAAVHRRTEFLKRVHAAEVVSLAGGMLGFLPGPMQIFTGPMISRVPFTPFNMVCTNVPGPQFPLYILGHKMIHWYPYVPIGGEMAVNCAILSYNGMVYFGFSGDAHAAPDLARFEKFLKLSFTELRDAACVGPKDNTPSRNRATKEPGSTKRVSERRGRAAKQVAAEAPPPSAATATVPLPVPLPGVKPAKAPTGTAPLVEEKKFVTQKFVTQMTA